MNKEHGYDRQMSFLTPEDAALVTLMRYFIAEAARIYETPSPHLLEEAVTIKSPFDAYRLLRVEMEHLPQEQLRTLNLNSRNQIIGSHLIYQGTVSRTTLRVAEIFRPAIVDNAVALIVAHNHPSGDPSPSQEDIRATNLLSQAGELLDIPVLDHIIIGHGEFVSLKERGVGFNTRSPKA